MNSILSRIRDISLQEGITLTQMERRIGASKGVLSRAVANNTDIQSKWLLAIVENYPHYSAEWLLSGVGTPKKEEQTEPLKINTEEELPLDALPFYDVDFVGGFSEVFDVQSLTPEYYISIPGFGRAEFWCKAVGDSMQPQITSGDLIALKECRLEDIMYGEVYAVIMDEIRTIKKIRKAESDEHLRFIPINPDYDEQEYHKKRILRIFEVLGSVRKFF